MFSGSHSAYQVKTEIVTIFRTNLQIIWDKVFKNGSGKIFERQPLKNLKVYSFKFFKSCLPQILFGPFLNTLSQIIYRFITFLVYSTDENYIGPYEEVANYGCTLFFCGNY